MARLLKEGTLPTVQALMAELNQNHYDRRYMNHYFQHGGQLEHAMNALISSTREEVSHILHFIYLFMIGNLIDDYLWLFAHPIIGR